MSSIPQRCCTKCGADKPLSEFSPRGDGSDQTRSRCKGCLSAERRSKYQHKGYPSVHSGDVRRCWKCGEWKPITEYHKSSGRSDGLDPRCKACKREYRRANKERFNALARNYPRKPEQARAKKRRYEAAHPDRVRQQQRRTWLRRYNAPGVKKQIQARQKQWRDANPHIVKEMVHRRRARKQNAGGSYTAQQWLDLCAYYDQRCLCCGLQEVLTVDHIVPLSRGGSNDISNIQPLCRACNSAKYDRTIDYRHDKVDGDKT